MPDDKNENQIPPSQDARAEDLGEDVHDDELLDEADEESSKDDQFLRMMAKAMPWLISLLFHVGLFLMMIFFVFLVLQGGKNEEIIVPDAVLSDNPGGQMTPSKNVTKVQTQTKQSQRKMRQESIKTDTGKTDKPLNIIATAGGTSGAASSAMSMSTGSSGGPRSSFFGSGGNAYNVVYVIDRSGSMVHTFDVAVRPELLRSIGRLRDSQMFHVILFAQGPPVELKYKRLVPATKRHKKEAASFLFADEVRPEGETDPVPALKRAFAVLSGARKKGRLIYLLTDGIFPDNEGVLRVIASQNKDKKVHINTFLYGTAPKEAVDVMTAIAEQNGGRYKFVEHE